MGAVHRYTNSWDYIVAKGCVAISSFLNRILCGIGLSKWTYRLCSIEDIDRIRRAVRDFVIIILSAFVIAVPVATYIAYERLQHDAVVVLSGPDVTPSSVKPGGVSCVSWRVRKVREAHGSISRVLICPASVTAQGSAFPTYMVKGEERTVTSCYTVPDATIAPAQCIARSQVSYDTWFGPPRLEVFDAPVTVVP